jgi:hypothetical protein
MNAAFFVPGRRTIEEVSAFLKLAPERFIKTLLYVAGETVCPQY